MEQSEPNAVARMLGLLGDEWTLLVVQQALLGATRYAEFKTRLPISNSVLTAPAAVADATTACWTAVSTRRTRPGPSTW